MVRFRFSASLIGVLVVAGWYMVAAGTAAGVEPGQLAAREPEVLGVAKLRVMHLMRDAADSGSDLTLLLDGEPLEFSYAPSSGSVTEYLGAQPGTHVLSVVADPSAEALHVETFVMDATSYTLVLSGDATQPELELVKDSVGALDEGGAGAVLVNVSQADLWVTGLGSALFDTEQLRPSHVSPRWDLRAGRRLISVGSSPVDASFSFRLRSQSGVSKVVVFDRNETVFVFDGRTVGRLRPLKKVSL